MEEINQNLTRPITIVKIKKDTFQIHPTKVTGLDDMPSYFFQKYWDIVKHDLVQALLQK